MAYLLIFLDFLPPLSIIFKVLMDLRKGKATKTYENVQMATNIININIVNNIYITPNGRATIDDI